MGAKFSKNIKLYGSSSLSNFSIFWRKYPVSPEQQSLTKIFAWDIALLN